MKHNKSFQNRNAKPSVSNTTTYSHTYIENQTPSHTTMAQTTSTPTSFRKPPFHPSSLHKNFRAKIPTTNNVTPLSTSRTNILLLNLSQLAQTKVHNAKKANTSKRNKLDFSLKQLNRSLNASVSQLENSRNKTLRLYKENSQSKVKLFMERNLSVHLNDEIEKVRNEVQEMKRRLEKERKEKMFMEKEGMINEREMYNMKKEVECIAKEVNELIEEKKCLSTEIVIMNRKLKEMKECLEKLIQKDLNVRKQMKLIEGNIMY